MEIGFRIKELRTKKGFTQKAFAELLNIDPSQFSKIEQSKVLPTLPQIVEIGSKLDQSLDYLILGIEQSEILYSVQESRTLYDSKMVPPVIDIVSSGSANVIILPAKSAASDFTKALTDPVYYKEGFKYETMALPQLQYRKGPFFATEIEGDGMHSTLTHGQHLVGSPIPALDFVGGYIYTFYHSLHGLITKRLHWVDKHAGILLMTCDNQDIDDQEIFVGDISPYMLKGICAVNFNLRNWNNDVRREIRDLRNDVIHIKHTLKL